MPSTRAVAYTLNLNDSPSVIGAEVLESATAPTDTGIKIAVVDDGIDQTNPFFDPAGFRYPPGFPLGNKNYTTSKVIVAESFPGPNAGTAGKLPLDPKSSFHGTHVAGIAAGVAGTTAPAGGRPPAVTGLSASRRARGSATTASSPCRRRSATSRTRPRSSPPSRPQSPTAWT